MAPIRSAAMAGITGFAATMAAAPEALIRPRPRRRCGNGQAREIQVAHKAQSHAWEQCCPSTGCTPENCLGSARCGWRELSAPERIRGPPAMAGARVETASRSAPSGKALSDRSAIGFRRKAPHQLGLAARWRSQISVANNARPSAARPALASFPHLSGGFEVGMRCAIA
jgi:hypothetical protein